MRKRKENARERRGGSEADAGRTRRKGGEEVSDRDGKRVGNTREKISKRW